MLLSAYELLKNDTHLRVKLKDKLRNKLLSYFDKNSIIELSKILRIHPKTLERKLKDINKHSFLLVELRKISSYLSVDEKEITSNIKRIKIGRNSHWIRPINIKIDEGYVAGVGYYVGDGRTKTNNGISTVNNEESVIQFFLKWLFKYFKIKYENVKIVVHCPNDKYDTFKVKSYWSKFPYIPHKNIRIIKRKGKRILHPLIEVMYYNKTIKKVYDLLMVYTQSICLDNKDYALAYLQGILASEGSPKYNKKSSSRTIHIKMKSKILSEFNKLMLTKIGCKPSIHPTSDGQWLVSISGYSDLKKILDLDGFKFHSKRRRKFRDILQTYKHIQVKKGTVTEFYLHAINDITKSKQESIDVNELSETLKKERSGVARVLQALYYKKLLERKYLLKTGRPYKYIITQEGKNFLKTSSLNL